MIKIYNLLLDCKLNSDNRLVSCIHEKSIEISRINKSFKLTTIMNKELENKNLIFSRWINKSKYVMIYYENDTIQADLIDFSNDNHLTDNYKLSNKVLVRDCYIEGGKTYILAKAMHKDSNNDLIITCCLETNKINLIYESSQEIDKFHFNYSTKDIVINFKDMKKTSIINVGNSYLPVIDLNLDFVSCLNGIILLYEVDNIGYINFTFYNYTTKKSNKVEFTFSIFYQFNSDKNSGYFSISGIKNGQFCIIILNQFGEIIEKIEGISGLINIETLDFHNKELYGVYEFLSTFPVFKKCKLNKLKKSIINLKHHTFEFKNLDIPYLEINKESEKAIILLHGGPHDCTVESFSPIVNELLKYDYNIYIINYPGSTGFGYKLRDSTVGDWGGIDKDSIEYFVGSILSGFKEINLYGVSYGGYLALLLAGLSPSLYNKVLVAASFCDLEALYEASSPKMKLYLDEELGTLLISGERFKRSPINYFDSLSRVNLLLIHGINDEKCEYKEMERLFKKVSNAKKCNNSKKLNFITFNQLGHEIYSEKYWYKKSMEFLTE